MATTADPSTDTAVTGPATASAATRLAGLAGMGFAASVIAQNIWSAGAGVLPDADASSADVIESFADAGAGPAVLAGWVVVNIVLLAMFGSGAYTRLRGAEPVWAGLGLIGTVALATLFAILQVPIVVLAAEGDALTTSPELVSALWSAHNVVFGLAGLALGLALVGFARAAGSAGLAPRWLAVAAPVAAAIMIAASVPLEAHAQGDAAVMVGLIGFVAWMLFLLVVGNRLRTEP